jgi:hypothetical protein
MLTTVVIIAVIIAFIIGVFMLKSKTKSGTIHPTDAADSSRPDAPAGYNARSGDPNLGDSGNINNRAG